MSSHQMPPRRVAETATMVQPPGSSGRRTNRFLRPSHFRVPVWFVLPALALYVLAMLYPLMSGAVLAFTDWNGLSAGWNFTWFDNLIRVVTDESAVRALLNQLIIAVTFPVLQNLVGLALALALNTRIKSRFVLRTIFFTPAVLTPVILAFLWQYIYSNNGSLNGVLELIGLGAFTQSWLGDPKLALGAIIVVIAWQYTGYSMVIYLAGLQAVPREVLEAAEVDGANKFQTFRSVTLPLLAPSLTINVILSSVIGLKVFDQVYAMTGGGPGDATQTLTVYQYLRAFNYGEFGYGTMVALVLAVLVSIVSALQYKFLRRNEEAAS